MGLENLFVFRYLQNVIVNDSFSIDFTYDDRDENFDVCIFHVGFRFSRIRVLPGRRADLSPLLVMTSVVVRNDIS